MRTNTILKTLTICVIVAVTMMSGCISMDSQPEPEMNVQFPVTTTYTDYNVGYEYTMHITLYPDNTASMVIVGIPQPEDTAVVIWKRMDHELHSATYEISNDAGLSATIILYEKSITKLDITGTKVSGTWK